MGSLSLNDVAPGMVTEEEVVDNRGRTILGTGITITEKHLKIFRMWGISEVCIVGIDRQAFVSQIREGIDPLVWKEAEREIERRFIHCDAEVPQIQELKQLALTRLAENLNVRYD